MSTVQQFLDGVKGTSPPMSFSHGCQKHLLTIVEFFYCKKCYSIPIDDFVSPGDGLVPLLL